MREATVKKLQGAALIAQIMTVNSSSAGCRLRRDLAILSLQEQALALRSANLV